VIYILLTEFCLEVKRDRYASTIAFETANITTLLK